MLGIIIDVIIIVGLVYIVRALVRKLKAED